MRTTRVSTATVLVGVALVAGLPDPSPAQVPLPPNVLIILTDDQREDGTMHVLPETQGLFGSGGVRFAHGVATTPLCCPSRASIFSGKYAHNHGVTTNNNGWRFDSDESMQAELSEAGYRTALVGKFLNDWALEQAPPHFERFSVFNRGYYGATFNVDGTMTEVEDYSTDFIADKSIEYLDEFETTDPVPWMMEIALYAPHIPAFPERQFATRPVGSLLHTPADGH